ncbi:helix-turn-helix domain-containing protein [Tardiphaga sp. 866_E4_N2_1]|uniref:helix-turn-helix domain-containing protein n=1 Tax=unclassified Tardiphaga TaxID=2631404 RepID=UPI003F28111D
MLSPEAVLAEAASQWKSVPTPEQITKALAASGYVIVKQSESSARGLTETLRGLAAGKKTREVGSQIAAVRKERGLTQEKLSAKLGCHVITVWKLENDKLDVSVEWLLRIADALYVDASALLSPTMNGPQMRTAAREAVG